MFSEEDIRDEAVLEIGKKMLIAARTAPKGKGTDNTVLKLCGRDEIKKISDHIKLMHQRDGLADYFVRDANCILKASAMLLLGTRIQTMGLIPCGMCGFANCAEKNKHPKVPCVFNTGDLGIAVGSAVSVAADNRVDNRVLYTAGQAAMELGLMGDGVSVTYAIPLSSGSKSPFFDR